jgi:hypothetical protein
LYVVGLLAFLVTGASGQAKLQEAAHRDKLIRDYDAIGRADTMAVSYDASCINADKSKRDQCLTEDRAALSAAIKAIEDTKEHPQVAPDGVLIVKLRSKRYDKERPLGPDNHPAATISLTVYDAKNNSVLYEQTRGALLLANDARQLLTEFLDLWAFLH